MEIQDKTFGKVSGKIVPESLFSRLNENELSFEIESNDGTRQWFKTDEKSVVSKVLSLFGINRRALHNDMTEKGNEADVRAFIQNTIKDKNRELVFLIDDNKDLTNVVTHRHKQLPLKDIFNTVTEVATASGFAIKSITETANSYQIHLDSGSHTNMMQSSVDVHLGRNDSHGRAGIHIQASGNIGVCSNQIIAHVGRDVMKRASQLGIEVPESLKLIHTTNIGQRFMEMVKAQMDKAKKTAILLGEKLKESQSIEMSREIQEKTIDLIAERHNLGKKWVNLLKIQLVLEDDKEPDFKETLYQLSQVLTYIGTHFEDGGENVRDLLCKMGGQVVILGKDFTDLVKESVEKRKIEVVQTTA